FAVMRVLPNGSIDTTFGSNGRTFTDFASLDDFANGIGIDRNGRIILVGTTFNRDSQENFAVARYSANGVLDTTFGIAGRKVTSFGGTSIDVATSVAFDASNRIVAAGFSRPLSSTYSP